MMDLYIGGDIDCLSEEVASMSRKAAFMEQLRDYLKSIKYGVLTDTEAVDGANEDPYLVLYIGIEFLKAMI